MNSKHDFYDNCYGYACLSLCYTTEISFEKLPV